MINEIKNGGGEIITRKLQSLDDIADEVDIIVNASGLGSYDLVPDRSMFPVRGQLIMVKAPWIKGSFSDLSHDNYCYAIPK